MTKKKRSVDLLFHAALYILIVMVVSACGPAQLPTSVVTNDAPVQSTVTTPTSAWDSLLQATPHAYFTPLPDSVPQSIDGTYAKIDQSWPQWWKCLRCADYRVTGGVWKLQFDKGVMRIFYETNGWRSLSSYTIEGDRLYLFNDPYCPENTGEYKWSVQNGQLSLDALNDPCAFDLRAENLTRQSWNACPDPSDVSSAAPAGCMDNPVPPPVAEQRNPSLTVNVYGGDARFFEKPPDVIAHANVDDQTPPEGIEISFAEDSIPYGLHRVLWWNGDWIEATVDGPYESIGVQILGEQAIGWGRVLFDGQEVWRGDTAAIWTKLGRHGGYIEISGFDPGAHTVRVESMNFDYRPVTVASFGLSTAGGVEHGEAGE